MYLGWQQIAYERELQGDLSAMTISSRRLLLVRAGGRIRTFDAYCPHRGADLSAGTLLDDGAIRCPFHGRRIGLGSRGEDGFCAREYRTMAAGGLIFVLFGDDLDRGFAVYMTALDQTRHLIPGFAMQVRARPELIIENAFDHRHFKHVHALRRIPTLKLEEGPEGQFCVLSTFSTGNANQWQSSGAAGEDGQLGFLARVFSPNLCVTEMDAENYKLHVLTAATPLSLDTCVIRVSIALPLAVDGATIDDAAARQLLRDSKTSIEQDRRIWEALSPEPINSLAADDALIGRYQQFCADFLRLGDG